MQEILFHNSPFDFVLCLIALALAVSIKFTIDRKTILKLTPFPIMRLIIILLVWNATAAIGNLFFYHAEFGVGKHILFGIQSLAWVQFGYALLKITIMNNNLKLSKFWDVFNALGILMCVVITTLFCVMPERLYSFFAWNICGLERHPVYAACLSVYVIFVFIPIIYSIYFVLRNIIHSNDKYYTMTNVNLILAYTAVVLIAFVMDITIPLIFSLDFVGGIQYFQWMQFSAALLVIICVQYYTSVSYKNKSYFWLLQSVFPKLSDSIFYYDINGKILMMNPMAEKVFKSEFATKQELNIKDLLPNLNLLKEGTINNIAIKINGEEHKFSANIFLVRQSLTSNFFAVLLKDLTYSLFFQQQISDLNNQFLEYRHDIAKYQDMLENSERQSKNKSMLNSTLINALPFQFWSKNERGVYITQNSKDINARGNLSQMSESDDFLTKYELEARETGMPSSFVSYESETHQELTEEEANQELKKDKMVFIYQNHFIPIVESYPPFKIIGLKIDITEERRLERERDLLREQRRIHSRLEELGTICGAFAHDYNNILGSQIGFCELAKEMIKKLQNDEKTNLPQLATINTFVDEAHKAATRGKESLNILLDSIRGETSKNVLATVFAPAPVVRDVIANLQITMPDYIQIISDNIDKNVRIQARVSSLYRILSNLASNAIDAMGESGGILTFSIERVSFAQNYIAPYSNEIPAGHYAKISVSDTGSGMSTTTLERIFSPFFTTKEPGKGLGLGLPSALRLLKEDGGYFSVQSTMGKGSIFNLYWALQNKE